MTSSHAAHRWLPGLLSTVIFAAAFRAFLYNTRNGDMESHLALARELDLRHITSPHFLFELLLQQLLRIGIPIEAAASLLLGACYGGMALLIAHEIGRRSHLTLFRAYVLIPALLLASQVFVFTSSADDLYRGYLSPVVYHNPTQQLNKLFALWVTAVFASAFVERRVVGPRDLIALGVLCGLSALAKPSFLIAFLPVAGLWALRDLFAGHRRESWLVIKAVIVPTVVVLLVQARIAYGADVTSSIVVAPFAIFHPAEIPLKFTMSLLFPLVVAIGALTTRTATMRLGVVWAFVAIALVYCLVLAEGGARMFHGNFAWTGQTAAFLIIVESALFLLSSSIATRWKTAAWSAFAVHVGCGVFWYGLCFSTQWHRYTGI